MSDKTLYRLNAVEIPCSYRDARGVKCETPVIVSRLVMRYAVFNPYAVVRCARHTQEGAPK